MNALKHIQTIFNDKVGPSELGKCRKALAMLKTVYEWGDYDIYQLTRAFEPQ